MNEPPDHGRQRGMILVIVLWTVAMMTIVVVALGTYARHGLSLAGVETSRLRTEMTLKSAMQAAGAMIIATEAKQRIFADGSAVRVDLGAGRLADIAIRDATGVVDINRAAAPLLAGLFGRVSESDADPEEFGEQIVAWREKNGGEAKEPADAAEAAETGKKAPETPPTFFSVAQLYGLPGIEARDIDKLLPYIALYSHGGRVNPMAAPEAVLQSVPEITPADIAILLEARARRNPEDPAVLGIVANFEQFLTLEESSVYLVDARVVSGGGLIAGSRLQATIVLDGLGKVPFRVAAWSW